MKVSLRLYVALAKMLRTEITKLSSNQFSPGFVIFELIFSRNFSACALTG